MLWGHAGTTLCHDYSGNWGIEMMSRKTALAGAALGLVCAFGTAQASDEQAALVGSMAADQDMTATIVFKLRHPKQLERYIQRTISPGGPTITIF